MPGSIYSIGNYTWVHDIRGNFVCVQDGKLAATVISSDWEPWQIIMHYEDLTHLLMGEMFDNPQDAMKRAGEIVSLSIEERNNTISHWLPLKPRMWQ